MSFSFFLACFPNGPPPESSELQFSLTKNSESRKNQIQLVAETQRIEYIGRNFGESSRSNPCNYSIGIFNPTKRKSTPESKGKSGKKEEGKGHLDLYPVSAIYSIKQNVKKLTQEDIKKKEEDKKKNPLTDDQKLQQFRSQRHMLIESYGSKKSQRVEHIKLADRVKITKDSNQKTKLTNIMEIQSLNEKPIGSEGWEIMEQTKRFQLPPFDPETDDTDEVYLMDEIFTEEEKTQLDTKQFEQLLNNPALMNKEPYASFPSFILYYLTRAQPKITTKSEYDEGPQKKKN